MSRTLKRIFFIASSLSVLLIVIFYLFLYISFNENIFTKNSIRYYFLSENMKTKLIIHPATEPIYWRGDLDSSVEYMNVYYCTEDTKSNLEKIFYNMGYMYDNNRLTDIKHIKEIYIELCEENNSLISVKIFEEE
jgi:hypothetical protein